MEITPRRAARFREVIRHRQPDLTVILEDITDPHNISAVLRSCDAVGVKEVYIIKTFEPRLRLGAKSSASATKWVKTHLFEDRKACIAAVRERYDRIYCTHLSTEEETVSLYDLDLVKPIALVFGNEHGGISEEVLGLSDGNFCIPQVGMISSLNISVACAVSLYEAFRQRKAAGVYEQSALGEEGEAALFKEWVDRDINKRLRKDRSH